MKVLIITQKVNKEDPGLGFFHRWITVFAEKFESITVVCLEKGQYDLPKNVKVFSLGKEEGNTKMGYVRRFYSYIWKHQDEYDAVFVHMNQEYVLLGAILWKLLGKPVFMWRNHYAGTFLTDIAMILCDKVFCTSKYSYTAKSKKTVFMPVGVDAGIFIPNTSIQREPRSILFLGRISPSKNIMVFIDALKLLSLQGVQFTANIYGDALPGDVEYYESLKDAVKKQGLGGHVFFHSGVKNHDTPAVYSAHELYVNLSPSGMYDKTIFEAMACGALVVVSNDNLVGTLNDALIIDERTATRVAQKINDVFLLDQTQKAEFLITEKQVAAQHSLGTLSDTLYREMSVGEQDRRNTFRQARIMRYLFSGSIGVVTSVTFLYILTDLLFVFYLYSAIVAFLASTVVSFCLQKYWTFRDKVSEVLYMQMGMYYAVAGLNLCLTALLMALFVSVLGLWHILAQLLTSALLAISSYIVYGKIFSNKKIPSDIPPHA